MHGCPEKRSSPGQPSSIVDSLLRLRIEQMQLLHVRREQQLPVLRRMLARVLEHDDLLPDAYIDQIGVAQRLDGVHMRRNGVLLRRCQLEVRRADAQIDALARIRSEARTQLLRNAQPEIARVEQFSLRYTTATNSRTATLQEEIENVRNYLQLAKARYEDNLEYAIDVPAELNGLTVPKLTLQPLVENALTHGYNGSNTLRRLSVTGRIESGELRLRIQDNGTGFTPEMLGNLSKRIEEIQLDRSFATDASTHIGLINTCLRLHYYSKGAMCMSIRNEDGAVVELTMPID